MVHLEAVNHRRIFFSNYYNTTTLTTLKIMQIRQHWSNMEREMTSECKEEAGETRNYTEPAFWIGLPCRFPSVLCIFSSLALLGNLFLFCLEGQTYLSCFVNFAAWCLFSSESVFNWGIICAFNKWIYWFDSLAQSCMIKRSLVRFRTLPIFFFCAELFHCM